MADLSLDLENLMLTEMQNAMAKIRDASLADQNEGARQDELRSAAECIRRALLLSRARKRLLSGR